MHHLSQDDAGFCWRPWPCEACRGDLSPTDFLIGRYPPSPEISAASKNELIEAYSALEAKWLCEWVLNCPHNELLREKLPLLAEGSEHSVYFDASQGEVLKSLNSEFTATTTN
jgi:hypothetical protein